MSARLYQPTNRGGEVFVPAMGRTCMFIELHHFTRSWKMPINDNRISFRTPLPGDETVIGSIGAVLSDAGQVYIDQQLEAGVTDAWMMNVRVNRALRAQLCLRHSSFFWPQLHELEMPFHFHDNDDLYIYAPPETLITISGLVRGPLGH